MNKDMLEDALAAEKRKTKILSIILAIAICAFVGMTIFAFCSFEVVHEETTEISYDADTGDGDNSTITQTNTNAENDNSINTICATIIACIGLIVLGVYLHGKSKNGNQKDQKTHYTQAQRVYEEKEVGNGTLNKD